MPRAALEVGDGMLGGAHQRQAGDHHDHRPALAGALLQQGGERGKLTTRGEVRLVQGQHEAGLACDRELGKLGEHGAQDGCGILCGVCGASEANLAADPGHTGAHGNRLRF